MDIPFLPAELSKIVIDWVYEFIRVESIDRINDGKTKYSHLLRIVHEDIRSNVPVYTFWFGDMTMSVSLPSCDPQRVRTDLHISENSIVSWQRRALGIRKGINVIYSE